MNTKPGLKRWGHIYYNIKGKNIRCGSAAPSNATAGRGRTSVACEAAGVSGIGKGVWLDVDLGECHVRGSTSQTENTEVDNTTEKACSSEHKKRCFVADRLGNNDTYKTKWSMFDLFVYPLWQCKKDVSMIQQRSGGAKVGQREKRSEA